ncbi:hypothetical protein D8674_009965 [Pyrus ussuriensis x Pyrus communis]|uniref:Uncharacterized protein n=1 Tax=Pyrus ussuriensis x Pyrus communis TaxID=2448454 RepID=A0A5N5FN39_9ROSA|nr:hypothetical protein D8674_009965 [Pyrus ussuriensis x Pyrus communis]
MAFLDVVTPNSAMDLRFMDLVVEFDSPRRLFDFLRIVFKWRTHWYWKKLYLPKAILSQQLLTWIAERAPLLEYLNVPKEFRYSAEGPPDLCSTLIDEKAAGVELHHQRARKLCEQCSPLYNN